MNAATLNRYPENTKQCSATAPDPTLTSSPLLSRSTNMCLEREQGKLGHMPESAEEYKLSRIAACLSSQVKKGISPSCPSSLGAAQTSTFGREQR